MDKGYPESLLLKLLEIYSPSGKEGAISKLLADEMAHLGFAVNVDEIGNVEGHYGKGKPRILLCGHMDTIQGPIEVRKRGKVVFGRGAVDAKSSLAALICGAKRYAEEEGKGSVTVLAVVDEEGKSRGIKYFLSRSKEKYDYAIFGEPSGVYAVTVGYKGRLLFKVTCKTSPGHAGSPQLFENAVYVAMRLIQRLLSLQEEWRGEEKADLFKVPTLCITGIEGGIEDNTVPSSCEVTVDVRIPSSMTISELKKKVLSVLNDFKAREGKAEIEINFVDKNPPYQEDPNSKLVKSFMDSIKEIKGRDCRLLRKSGTADVNDFVMRFRTPAVVYGPGNSKLDHTPKENVSVEEYLISIDVITAVLKKITA
ncbi:MAG: M20/M25/M40 family metallo-hydrolase [Candidatus Methanomethyliaceae archaeon]|nr:M20/M25/M40 family metallo-hydrolase [Candidatus Methanomethyliaceae archaeon]